MIGPIREEWMDAAVCAETDPELFFADKGDWAKTIRAKLICRRCHVRDACLAYAIRHRVAFGVWGGMTPRQRDDIRRGRREFAS